MNSFDDFIQQRIKGHKTPVPANTWNNIENKEKKRRRFFFWFTIIALLSGLLIAGYYRYQKDKPVENIATNKLNSGQTKQEITKSDNTKKNINDDHSQIAPKKETVANNSTSEPQKEIIAGKDGVIKKPNSNSSNEIASIKNEPGKSTDISSANTHATTTINKNKRKQNIRVVPAHNNKYSKNENDLLAVQKKNIKKTRGKSNIKTQQGETEIIVEPTQENNEVSIDISKQKQLAIQQDQSIAENKKEVTDTKTTEPVSQEFVKKEPGVDTMQKKQVPPTAAESNQKKSPKKQSKKHEWFLDIAATPVLPIQQYNKAVFSRTIILNDTKSEFTGDLTKTSVDPSVAFSISLRRSFNKRFFAGIGIQYLQLKEDVRISGTETNTKYTIVDRLVNSVNGPELVSDTVETISGGIRNINATNSYQFISIPVFVQYNIIQNRSWSFGITGGMILNVFSKYQNEIDKNNSARLVNVSQPVADKSKAGFALYGGFRFGKYFGKRIEIFTLPSFSWTVGEQSIKNSLINKKIQRVGLSVGVSAKIK